ncbi:MAG: hypothetical protein AAFO69_11505 [Bacteroidota bacterium]
MLIPERSQSKNTVLQAGTAVLLFIILAYLFTFIRKIGLHGDEAFFGLDAIDVLKNGLTRLYGLNKYTGILQTMMNAMFFRLGGIDIYTLRLGGILCNTTGLLLIIYVLRQRHGTLSAFVFLLLFAQSAFLLTYAKVAWEVCTFNLLFIGLLLFAFQHLDQKRASNQVGYRILFLSAAMMGAYNHILFSSLLLTAAISIPLWQILSNSKPTKCVDQFCTLVLLALFNITAVFGLMNLFIDTVWQKLGILTFALPTLLIIPQAIFFRHLPSPLQWINYLYFKIKIPLNLSKLLTIVFFLAIFTKVHSLKFLDILSHRVLFLRVFSFELPGMLSYFFILSAMILISTGIFHAVRELLSRKTSFQTYFIIVYLFVICLYTRGASIRYFHILTVLLFLYLAVNVVWQQRILTSIFVFTLTMNMVITQGLLWNLNLDHQRPVRPFRFKIGISSHETSAHFLNFSPVVETLKKHKVGKINTDSDFFIGNVFQFYRYTDDEIGLLNGTATVEYDFRNAGTGFKIVIDGKVMNESQ